MATRNVEMTITYLAWDTSANAGKTGDVGNHTLRWVKDGTSSAPTNSAAEVDATNAPGIYKITMTATETDANIGVLCGKSSTADITIVPITLQFERLPDADPAANGGLPTVDASNHINGVQDTLSVNVTTIEGSDATDQINAACDTALADYDAPTKAEMDSAFSTTDGKIDVVDGNVDDILVDTAEIGTAGAGLTAVAWNSSWDAEVQSECNDALVALGLDHLISASVAGSDVVDNSIIAKLVSKESTADWDDFINSTDSLQALRDYTGTGYTAIPWNASWDAEVESECTDALNAYDPPTKSEMDTSFTTTNNKIDVVDGEVGDILLDTGTTLPATLATIDGIVDNILLDTGELQTDWANGGRLDLLLDSAISKIDVVDGVVDDILVDTAVIGAAGAGLTAVPWNSSWDAEVQSECNDALVALNLDHLVSASVSSTDVADDSIIAKLVSKEATADWDDYVNTTDSLQAQRDYTGSGYTAIPWNSAWDTEVESEVTDALNAYDPPTKTEMDGMWTSTQTESYAADDAEATPAQLLYMILCAVSEFSVSGTTITGKELDGTTTAMTWTIDDASNPTLRTRAT
jgi:hypothetical protein